MDFYCRLTLCRIKCRESACRERCLETYHREKCEFYCGNTFERKWCPDCYKKFPDLPCAQKTCWRTWKT